MATSLGQDMMTLIVRNLIISVTGLVLTGLPVGSRVR